MVCFAPPSSVIVTDNTNYFCGPNGVDINCPGFQSQNLTSQVDDNCGICNGQNSSMDCAGVCWGPSLLDEQGNCCRDFQIDCAGRCNGNASLDNFGVCCLGKIDCFGHCNGTGTYDSNNTCCLGPVDCSGMCNGTKVQDNNSPTPGCCYASEIDCSGYCRGGRYNDSNGLCCLPSQLDCGLTCNGTKIYDNSTINSTLHCCEPNLIDCAGVCGSGNMLDRNGLCCRSAFIDTCNVCNGTNTCRQTTTPNSASISALLSSTANNIQTQVSQPLASSAELQIINSKGASLMASNDATKWVLLAIGLFVLLALCCICLVVLLLVRRNKKKKEGSVEMIEVVQVKETVEQTPKGLRKEETLQVTEIITKESSSDSDKRSSSDSDSDSDKRSSSDSDKHSSNDSE